MRPLTTFALFIALGNAMYLGARLQATFDLGLGMEWWNWALSVGGVVGSGLFVLLRIIS